jgi:NAD(P)-dependent dehydrogenase (short-subunit alcohol dehydrogenase family)
MEPRGAWALVTGGAKRLGKGIAMSLAKAGTNVVVHHGHSADQAEETVDELRALGVEAFSVAADLTRPAAIETLFSQIEVRCGGLQVLVNSAASFQRKALHKISLEEFDGVIDLNLRAPWLCLRQASRLMLMGDEVASGRRPECGVIVNMADLTGVRPWAGYSHHGVSKAGLAHLTKIAALELAPLVRVNCVVPGAILPPPGTGDDDPQWKRKVAGIPLQRSGDPSVVGDAVVFLVRNHFVTGSVLMVDGGEQLLGGNPVETLA